MANTEQAGSATDGAMATLNNMGDGFVRMLPLIGIGIVVFLVSGLSPR